MPSSRVIAQTADPEIFPDPDSFDPQQRIDADHHLSGCLQHIIAQRIPRYHQAYTSVCKLL